MAETVTKKRKRSKLLRRILRVGCIAALAGILCITGLNLWVVGSTGRYICESPAEGQSDPLNGSHDCIIILGAGLYGNEPSPMLKDRLEKGISLYKSGAAPKILMSGDHGRTGYNEVEVMKQYAINAGIPSSDIFMDHAGFSTYDSMVRARDVFEVTSPIIVTQKYHLYRAVFIGRNLDINCLGIATDDFKYGGQFYRSLRECAARCKDILTVTLHTPPAFGGDRIPITGNGDVTND